MFSMSLFPWRCFLPSRLAKRRTLPTARASRFLEAERSSRQTRLPRAANKRSLRSRIAACLPNNHLPHALCCPWRRHVRLGRATTGIRAPPVLRVSRVRPNLWPSVVCVSLFKLTHYLAFRTVDTSESKSLNFGIQPSKRRARTGWLATVFLR